MKKLIQGALLPFAIFTAGIALIGCEQAQEPTAQYTEETHAAAPSQSAETQAEPATTLKSGNMFYVVRDVADLQLKAGTYIEQLQQTQSDLQAAIQNKDQQLLQSSTTQLQQQLSGFSSTLNGLNLKSQEVDAIRQHIVQTNQQLLASPLLNGQVDFSQVDVKKIEQQIGSVQSEMIKLAALLIPAGESSDSQK